MMTGSKNDFTTIFEDKPWGKHAVLSDAGHYKVKELVINPGKRLSLQVHQHRTEYWTVIEGEVVATVDGNEIVLGLGEQQIVPAESIHRIANESTEPAVVLEIQFLVGDVLSEDDIIRLEDDYGRLEEENPFEEDTVEYLLKPV